MWLCTWNVNLIYRLIVFLYVCLSFQSFGLFYYCTEWFVSLLLCIFFLSLFILIGERPMWLNPTWLSFFSSSYWFNISGYLSGIILVIVIYWFLWFSLLFMSIYFCLFAVFVFGSFVIFETPKYPNYLGVGVCGRF